MAGKPCYPPDLVVPTELIEADTDNRFYLFIKGEKTGPHDYASVRALAQSKECDSSATYWRTGMHEWRPLQELLGDEVLLPLAPQSQRIAIADSSAVIKMKLETGAMRFTPRPKTQSLRHRILVVDDDVIIREMISSLADAWHAEVRTAASLDEAQEKLQESGLSDYGCVLTDYVQPGGKTGLDLLEWVKERDPNLNVILITSRDDKEMLKRGIRSGIYDFIEKPIRLKELKSTVQAAIEQTMRQRNDTSTRYDIRERLGKGGIGEVFAAMDQQLQRLVAIKRLRTSMLESAMAGTDLLHEARVMAKLQHPHVVQIYDVGVDKIGVFFVMEMVNGKTLEQMGTEKSPWKAKDVATLAHQCLQGICAAHQLGILHLDIKPSNIMLMNQLNGDIHAKLLDFGLARFQQHIVQRDHDDIIGSPHYIAPECLERKTPDVRTDLYSLGCVLYYCACKQDAFEGDTVSQVINAHLEHQVTPIWENNPYLPLPFAQWIMSLMERDPDKRPPSALDALTRLECLNMHVE